VNYYSLFSLWKLSWRKNYRMTLKDTKNTMRSKKQNRSNTTCWKSLAKCILEHFSYQQEQCFSTWVPPNFSFHHWYCYKVLLWIPRFRDWKNVEKHLTTCITAKTWSFNANEVADDFISWFTCAVKMHFPHLATCSAQTHN
jgi:hypothetical protein